MIDNTSVNRPPVLDEMNCAYWKACMCAFLKCVDNKNWKAINNGWSSPTIKYVEGLVVFFKCEKD